MPTLEDFQNILQSAQQAKVEQSPLYQHAMKEAALQQQQQQEIPPEVQAVFDELKGTQERNAVRTNLQRYHDAVQYRNGGYVNKFDGTGKSAMHPYGPMYRYMPEYYMDFGIGNHPDFDEDFRKRYGLRYAPYNEIDFGETAPDNIRVQNQGNVTAAAFQWDNPSGKLLVGPDNKIVNKERLAELSRQYRAENADAVNRRYSTLNGEKPAQPVAPEFWLLAGAAPKAAGALNSVISPLFNMAAVDNVISDVSPYNGYGNMMSQNFGGPEWAWDLTHPAFAKDMWNLSKAAGKSAYNWMAEHTPESAYNMGIMPGYMQDWMSDAFTETGSTKLGNALASKAELEEMVQDLMTGGMSRAQAEQEVNNVMQLLAQDEVNHPRYADLVNDLRTKVANKEEVPESFFDKLYDSDGFSLDQFRQDVYDIGKQYPSYQDNVFMRDWPGKGVLAMQDGAKASMIPLRRAKELRNNLVNDYMKQGMSREDAEQRMRSFLYEIYDRNPGNKVIKPHEGLLTEEEFDPALSQFDTYEEYKDAFSTLTDPSKDTLTETAMFNDQAADDNWQAITGLDFGRYFEEAPHGARINIHDLSLDSYHGILNQLAKGNRTGLDHGIKVVVNNQTYPFNNYARTDAFGNPLTSYDSIKSATDKVNQMYNIELPYPSSDLKTRPGFTIFKYKDGGPINLLKNGGSTSNNKQLWDRARPLYNELTAAGVPHMAAVGVLGNIALESGVNPNASNKTNGGHWGYTQNDKAITNHIKKYYGGYGHKEQMQFLKDGLTGRIRGAKQAPWLQKRFDEYKHSVNGVNDPAKAAMMWEKYYEKSSNEALDKRADYAKYFHSALGGPDYQYSPEKYNSSAMLGPLTSEATEAGIQEQAPWYNQYKMNDADYAELYNQSAMQLPWMDQILAWNPMQAGQQSGTYPNLFAGGGYIEDGLRSLGVNGFRVTSGYRGPNSKIGKAGKRSGHARTLKDGSSGAIDIVPTDKSPSGWARLEQQLRSPEVQRFLASFGGTILDERDAATMKKTGATGQHFHIGLGVKDGGNFYNQPAEQSYAQRSPISAFSPIQSSTVGESSYTPWYAQSSGMTDEDWAALYNNGVGVNGIPFFGIDNLSREKTTFPAII